ncbi:MAG TPA: DUF268 domain-containing protein [Verrucomicrobiae bacterium]
MKDRLRKIFLLRFLLESWRALRRHYGLNFGWLKGVSACTQFYREFRAFQMMQPKNPHFTLNPDNLYPCLLDRTDTTPLEPVYFVQDTWFAHRLSQVRPLQHVDVGSSAKTMALVAQFVPVTMVDIRPVVLKAVDFSFREGSILSLPFADSSVASLSSLCVVEHIGLGRYGDPFDPWGSEKAWQELLRVLQPGGHLYISVPIDSANHVYYNAHRAFTRQYVLQLSAGLELLNEQYLYGYDVQPHYAPERGFGTGMFHFRKPPANTPA